MENIGDLIINFQSNKPDKIAIIDKEKEYTSLELANKIYSLQNKLPKNINGKVVLTFFPNTIEYIISYFAVSMLGGIVFPLHWKSKTREVDSAIKNSQPLLCLTNHEGVSKLKLVNIKKLVVDNKDLNDKNTPYTIRKNKDDIAILLQTSGTTDNSKIVALTHNNLISNSIAHCHSVKLDENSRILITLPFPFGYCNTSQLIASMYLQSTLVLINDPILPSYLFKVIEKYKINTFTAVPTLLNLIEKYSLTRGTPKADLSSLNTICFGGGTITKSKIAFLKTIFPHVSIYQTYGQTEAGPRITSSLIEEEYIPEKVGKPLEHVQIKILNENLEELTSNQIGQIFVKSPGIMKGYYNNQALTDKILSDGWLATGDLGFQDTNGYIYIKGRIKNIIKYSGYKIYPEEIESLISNQLGITSLLLKGCMSETYGEIPVLYIKGLYDKNLEDSIFKICRENLAFYKIPHKIFFIKDLETTKNGKLKRNLEVTNV
ncbi:class I adenylate-forming enzyme family protein [Bacillus cereus]|uniref:class I adenylate-forming enzyme family protein n=1 Tax=Bacillus cereus TaxID=1396 RepID=UPI00123C7A1F|nr:class I adenylate-forming enzyme family protein [Bacillus cereus]KAA6470291.1 long-chain fatty acid--CoA ligase [Bacillus cereus]